VAKHQYTPKYKIGDLVKCFYDSQVYFTGMSTGGRFCDRYYHGIIVGFHPDEDFPFYKFYGPFYEVLCFDGYRHYFSEWEIILLGRAS
jgi:hypothetical protein